MASLDEVDGIESLDSDAHFDAVEAARRRIVPHGPMDVDPDSGEVVESDVRESLAAIGLDGCDGFSVIDVFDDEIDSLLENAREWMSSSDPKAVFNCILAMARESDLDNLPAKWDDLVVQLGELLKISRSQYRFFLSDGGEPDDVAVDVDEIAGEVELKAFPVRVRKGRVVGDLPQAESRA